MEYLTLKSEEELYSLRLEKNKYELIKIDVVRGLLLSCDVGVLTKEELKEIKSFETASFKIGIIKKYINRRSWYVLSVYTFWRLFN